MPDLSGYTGWVALRLDMASRDDQGAGRVLSPVQVLPAGELAAAVAGAYRLAHEAGMCVTGPPVVEQLPGR